MKRFLMTALIGLLIGNLAFGASSDVKSQIGVQDMNMDSDNANHGTFQRRTSTGGQITLDKTDGNQIPWSNAYTRTIRPGDIITKGPYVDVRAYGAITLGAGASTGQKTANVAAIQAALDNVGTLGGGTVVLPAGTIETNSAIQITSLHRNVTLRGQGIGATIISGDGAAIYGFAFANGGPSTIDQVTFEGFSIRSCATGGINFTASISSNIDFDRVDISLNGIGINITPVIVVNLRYHNGIISSNATGVNLEDGANVSVISFSGTSLRLNTVSAYKAIGNAIGTTVDFSGGCIVEANTGQVALELGNNATNVRIVKTHFETNGGTTDGGADIHIGTGSRAINISNNTFSSPATTVTDWYNIRMDQQVESVATIENNSVACYQGIVAGYNGFVRASGTVNYNQITLRNNKYSDPNFNYLSSNLYGAYTLLDRPNGYGHTTDGLLGYVQTTDNTATTIWAHEWLSNDPGTKKAYYVTADVVAIDNTGAVLAAYTRRVLIVLTVASPANATIQGTTDETEIETDAGMNCVFAIGGDNNQFLLRVTGLTSKTINWTASLHIVHARF